MNSMMFTGDQKFTDEINDLAGEVMDVEDVREVDEKPLSFSKWLESQESDFGKNKLAFTEWKHSHEAQEEYQDYIRDFGGW